MSLLKRNWRYMSTCGRVCALFLLGFTLAYTAQAEDSSNLEVKPAHRWLFNDATGTNVADSVGAANGTLVNSPTWATDGQIPALRFDGINDSVSLGTAASLSGYSDFTIMGWIKTDAATNQVIIQQRDTRGWNGQYKLSLTSEGKVSFLLFRQGSYQANFSTTKSVNDGEWHHISVVRFGHYIMIYVDGKISATAEGSPRKLVSSISTHIGADVRDGNSYFKGLIYDVRIYNKAISDMGVTALMSASDATLSIDPDTDLDGLSNVDENTYGTDPNNRDTDGDGFWDAEELFTFHTSATNSASSPTVLPTGWNSVNIGTAQGKTLYFNDKFIMTGKGVHAESVDNFQMAYVPAHSQECQITARLTYRPADGWNYAGITIRDTLTTNSANVLVHLPSSVGSTAQARSAIGGGTYAEHGNQTSLPYWFRIKRKGNLFECYQSADGQTWNLFSTKTIRMKGQVYVGLACAVSGEAHFDNVAVTRQLDKPTITPDSIVFADSTTFKMSSKATNAQIRYTTDGSEPVLTSTLYTAPVTVSQTTAIRAKAFLVGYEASEIATSNLLKGGYVKGLTAKYYQGSYHTYFRHYLPDFTTLSSYGAKMLPKLDYPNTYGEVAESGKESGFAIEITGKLFIPTTGNYIFYTDADDQMKLYVDGTLISEVIWSDGQGSGATILTKGLHDIKVEYAETSGLGRLQLFWKGPGFEKQVLPKKNFFSVDSDQDQLSDDWEMAIYQNLTTSNGSTDADGDSYPEAQEVTLFRTARDNASEKPLAATATQTLAPGLLVSYYAKSWDKQPNFHLYPHYKTDVTEDIQFYDTLGVFATSGRADHVGALFQGYIDIPADGSYTFFINSYDGSMLYIDGKEVIDNNGLHGMKEANGAVALKAGKHHIRLEFFEAAGTAGLILDWEGSDFEREAIPAKNFFYDPATYTTLQDTIDTDSDGLTDAEETVSDPTKFDTDADGLNDFEELKIYHTNPLVADTDNDGVDDYTECKLAFSNPLVADFNGTVTSVQTITGSTFKQKSAGWETHNGKTYATAQNGWLEYDLNFAQAGTYRLTVEGSQHNELSPTHQFSLSLYIDGKFVATQNLNAPYGTVGKLAFYLPELTAGMHTAKVVWNNIYATTSLQIDGVKVDSLGGPDANANGKADWIDHRIANVSKVTVPATSKTSPLCVEGANAPDLSTIAITNYYTVEGEEPVAPVISRALGKNWYSNVTLNPAAVTNLNFSFGNSADTVQKSVTWTSTNVLTEDAVTIRQNEALLLVGKPDGQPTAPFTIAVEGQTLTSSAGEAKAYKFENAGTFTISATYNGTTTGTMTVKVVSTNFASSPSTFVNVERKWANPNIDEEAVLSADSQLKFFERRITNAGRSLELLMTTDRHATIIARLGENGPILDSRTVKAIQMVTTADKAFVSIMTFDDGSQLWEGQLTFSHVPSDIKILMNIFAAGVTFDDGSIEKTFTAADFDENGMLSYRFIRPANQQTSTCHWVAISQNGETIKRLE